MQNDSIRILKQHHHKCLSENDEENTEMELCLQTPKLNTLLFSANILFSHGYLHIHNRYCRLSTLDTYKMPSECITPGSE